MKHFTGVFILVFWSIQACTYNIGLCIVATGKYIAYVQPLIESAEKYFCTNHNVTYFIFTDASPIERSDTITVFQKKLGWPYDTMMRPSMYYTCFKNSKESQINQQRKISILDMDFLFSCDADMRFVSSVGDEILHERVGTLHPGYVNSPGTYETNPISRAYVRPGEARYYFAGGFWGGSQKEFFNIAGTITANVEADLLQGHIAVWHEESHLNRYFIDHPPTLILSPSYCYPESLNLPYPKKLLALDKNHSSMRD